MERKIIHIDADCFFAAVEMRDNPALANVPLAIGGPEKERGVIATANYQAREFGVHSAMSSAKAKLLCPNLILLRGNMEKYRLASRQMHAIFRNYTDLIEPLSLDEAYLDVSDCKLCYGSATLIAEEIRERIRLTVGITVSAGIAGNKFLAKIASDMNKPNGQFVITPSEQDEFIKQVPVKRIFGVGKVSQEKLRHLNVHTCEDLQKVEFKKLHNVFGKFAYRLQQLSFGIDSREIATNHIRKSLSVENTFRHDLVSLEECQAQLPMLLEELNGRLKSKNLLHQQQKMYLKMKFNNFQQTTVERMLPNSSQYSSFCELMEIAYQRQSLPVRLIGIGYRLKHDMTNQLSLF
ncbi:DNA polymerase IV [Marinomonas agarivorans]|nr:DNA polymerase IV [Marinomonas agarivorans]